MKFTWKNQATVPLKVRTFLAEHGVSRSLLKQVKFHGGNVLVDGQPQKVIAVLHGGETITMITPTEIGNDHLVASQPHLKILHEDENFLLINKPAGLASVPGHHYPTDTLANQVKGYYQQQGYLDQVVHIATRLDRETSGIVIFAKHQFAHAVLDKQLKKHQPQKTYLAVVQGQLDHDHDLIDLPIDRDPESFIKRQVSASGKDARTEYWVLQRQPTYTVVRVQLHTGRTHQIRVHFAAIGHPLLGDVLYNPTPGNLIQRQALHCMRVTFDDPFAQRPLTVLAPLPTDIAKLLR